MEDKRICPSCNKENKSNANFCVYCGTKITEECPRCWVKELKQHNCGFEKCIGYRLHVVEKRVAAPEVPVQEQASININQLRVKNGLEPIPNGDFNFIPTKGDKL